MVYGYARVSKTDQNLDLQLDSIKKYGVSKIFEEKTSGTNNKKPILDKLIKRLKKDDKLVIWRLDRLGRRAIQLMKLQQEFERKKITLVSLTEKFDTSSPMGKFAFHMICCFAEMEHNVISERTKAGLIAAKQRGICGGRPKRLSSSAKKKVKEVVMLYRQYLEDRAHTINDMCEIVGVSKNTFYKYLRKGGFESNIQKRNSKKKNRGL